jgi:hypothetical protein
MKGLSHLNESQSSLLVWLVLAKPRLFQFKVEVEKDGAFVTVYTRSFATGAQVGGLITGEASGKVTDTTITLNTISTYR